MNSLFLRAAQLVFSHGGRIAPRMTGFFAYQLFCMPPRPNRHVAKKAASVFAAAETITLKGANRELRVYRWTPPPHNGGAKGPRTVILVHGWGGSAHSMHTFVEPLLRDGFHVVAFDAPAHGASSGLQTTLLKSAESLESLASEVASPYAIVGHSFGGVVGSVAASAPADYPLRQPFSRLVIMSSPDRMTDMLSRYGAQLRIAPAALSYMEARIEKVARRSIEELSTHSFVAASNIPTLVIHDDDDKEVPVTDGRAIAAAPGARFLGTKGLGHRRVLRSAFVIEAVTAFLNGVSSV